MFQRNSVSCHYGRFAPVRWSCGSSTECRVFLPEMAAFCAARRVSREGSPGRWSTFAEDWPTDRECPKMGMESLDISGMAALWRRNLLNKRCRRPRVFVRNEVSVIGTGFVWKIDVGGLGRTPHSCGGTHCRTNHIGPRQTSVNADPMHEQGRLRRERLASVVILHDSHCPL
jgi:hypothetical protein